MKMSASAIEKMELKDGENQTEQASGTPEIGAEGENLSDELNASQWSVMSFDDVAVRGLSYEEAVRWLAKLRSQNVHGLCIVTDEAANRFSSKH